MKLIQLVSILLIFSFFFSCNSGNKPIVVNSPDQKVSITIGIDQITDNQLNFKVSYLGDEIVKPSQIGMSIVGDSAIGKNLRITQSETKELNETWDRVWGKSKTVVNHCFEATINMEETVSPFRKFNLIARAYNDGIAFRYEFPEQDHVDSLLIGKEYTTFSFASDYEVWASLQPGFVTSQEREFKKINLSKLKATDIVVTPLLVKLNKGWAALLEANLTNWAGMFLTAGNEKSNMVQALLSPYPEEKDITVKTKTPAKSPWRVLMLGEKAGNLIESNLLHNLSEPNKLEDTSWIVPGRSAWDSWWCGGYGPGSGQKLIYDNASMKYFIDFASEMGWEYQIVDWLWYGEPFKVRYSEIDTNLNIVKSDPKLNIPELVEYAKSKNVRLFLWAHYKHLDRQMDEAFATYQKWGIAGVKIDFMNRNDQEIVNFYHKVIKKAAEHQLLVIFHGAYMPTGEDRTYPNFITREGVLGNEASKWGNKISPQHCVTLPFTRMLGGHMDFTPGGFRHAPYGKFEPVGTDTENPWVQGTRCFQLAMPVVYESAVTIYCDSPDSYRGAEGLDFYKKVPTVWDETKVIDGIPGEFIVMARRSGNDWFLGAMTNNDERELEISLSFLNEGTYQTTIYSDAADTDLHPENLDVTEKEMKNTETIKVKLAHGGGLAVHFKKSE